MVQLSDNKQSRERTPTYVSTSMSVDVYAKGTAQLQNGRTIIHFDRDFSNVISKESPVIITVTPQGNTNGVYTQKINSDGFTIIENNNGQSNVSVSWIAVGTKNGYEEPVLPNELLSKEYDKNMTGVMHNENDTKTNGKPMRWDGKILHFDGK
jgi:hypothetical protein